jgi:hypothetical protein
MLPSLSTHPLAFSVQKKSLLGAGGVFLTKGKRKLEVDTTTRRRIKRQWHVKQLWHNKKLRDNQPGEWEAKARQEVAALAKALAEQLQLWVRQQSTKKRQQL